MSPITESPSQRLTDAHRLLGHAVSILIRTTRASFSFSAARYWIQPAIDLGQLRVLFDAKGVPVAFLTWAFVGDEVAAKLGRDEVIALHFSEWNEGLNLWIVDFVAIPGYGFSAARWVCRNMFHTFCQANAVRSATEGGRGCRLMRFRRRPHADPREPVHLVENAA